MKGFITYLAYIGALMRANWKAHHAEIKRTTMLGGFMLLQNLLFFMLWVVFFGSVGQVKGWRLQDIALMYGIVATAIGIALFTCDGIRTLGLRIQDGSIDGFLTKPRHPLPALLFSRSSAASLGDILSGPVYWFVFCDTPLTQLPKLVVFCLLTGIIFLSAIVMFYSLAFWLRRSGRFSDQLFEILITFSSIPQHGQPLGLKLIIFTIMPAGFIGLLPVSLMHDFNIMGFATLMTATVVYATLAVFIFNAGVKRYISETGI